VRSVDRLSILLDMAKVLHVDVEALTGRPWQYAPNGSSFVDELDSIRRVLVRYCTRQSQAASSAMAIRSPRTHFTRERPIFT